MMSLIPEATGTTLVPSPQWLPQMRWASGGYPEVQESVQTFASLEVAEIGSTLQQSSPGEAGIHMRQVAHQLLSAAVAAVGLDAFELRYRVTPRPSGQADVHLY